MKEYSREKIRNIALISPHGSGKTSLAEAILYLGGATEKLGRVDDGSSILDYEAEEQSRGMSINSSVAFFDWNDHLVNVVDTPGFTNFLFETESALRVTNGALFVMSGIAGVKAQNLKFWRMAVDAGVPRIVFINKLDKERSAFEEAISELEEELGIKLLPLTLPIGKEESFRGIIFAVRS